MLQTLSSNQLEWILSVPPEGFEPTPDIIYRDLIELIRALSGIFNYSFIVLYTKQRELIISFMDLNLPIEMHYSIFVFIL